MLHKPPLASPKCKNFGHVCFGPLQFSRNSSQRQQPNRGNCTEKWKTPTQRGTQDKINGLVVKASYPFPLVFLLILHGDSILIVVFALCFGSAVQQTNNKRITDWGNILKHNKRRQKRSVEVSRFAKIYTYVCLYVPESPGRTFESYLTVCMTPICVVFMPTLWHKGLQIETIILRVCSKNVYGNFLGICQTRRCLWFLQPATIK